MKYILIALVRFYQKRLSPYYGGGCYYEPSCSQYMILSLQKFGALKGLYKGLHRLVSCRPGCPGGSDYP